MSRFLVFIVLAALMVLSLGKQQPTLKDLQGAKDSMLDQLHTVMGADVTKLRVVPSKDQKLQAVGGWAYAGLYYEDCGDEDDAFFSIGFATDVCLSSAVTNGKPPRSFVYSCSDGKDFLLSPLLCTHSALFTLELDSWSEAIYNNYNCDPAGFLNTTIFNVTTSGCGPYPPMPVDDDSLSVYVARYYCAAGPTVDLESDYVMNQYVASPS